MRTRPGLRILIRPTIRYCARCHLEFVAFAVLDDRCRRCQDFEAGATPAPKNGRGAAPVETFHRADFFGCSVTLHVTLSGVHYRWSPHPNSKLNEDGRERQRAQFSSWCNRFVKIFAAEHGCAVRPVPAEPDLLEPCPRESNMQHEARR
jgi:hypothetical protein